MIPYKKIKILPLLLAVILLSISNSITLSETVETKDKANGQELSPPGVSITPETKNKSTEKEALTTNPSVEIEKKESPANQEPTTPNSENKSTNQETTAPPNPTTETTTQTPTETTEPEVEEDITLKNGLSIDLSSERVDYQESDDSFVATGNAKIVIPEEKTELIADKITYYQATDMLKAEGNLKIIKGDKTIYGDFANINLKEHSALVTNPNAIIKKVIIKAQEANLKADVVDIVNGTAVLSQEKLDISVKSNAYKPEELPGKIPGYESIVPTSSAKKPVYRIVAKEIDIDVAKKNNNLVVKGASLYIGKVKVFILPKITLTIGNKNETSDVILPDVGFDKNIGGFYMGPSFDIPLPLDSLLVVSPVVSAFGKKHDIGGGVLGHFRSGTNKTDIAYTSTRGQLILKGQQNLYKDTTKINYMINDYPSNGIMGLAIQRPTYITELVDNRKIGTIANTTLSTLLSGGIARDVDYGTTTSRIQAQFNLMSDKPIIAFKDYIGLKLVGQGSFGYYGTGDTYTIIRGGPRIDCKIDRLTLATTYLQAGVWGHSPFVFDQFVRGKYNLVLAGSFRLFNFLSIGNLSSLNLAKDGPDPKFANENQFFVRIGPEDIKFRAGYDFVRKRITLGVDLFFGSGRSGLNFDKLKVLHPEANPN